MVGVSEMKAVIFDFYIYVPLPKGVDIQLQLSGRSWTLPITPFQSELYGSPWW